MADGNDSLSNVDWNSLSPDQIDQAYNQGMLTDEQYTQLTQQGNQAQGQSGVNLNADPNAPQANGFAPGQYYSPTGGFIGGGNIGYAGGYQPQANNLPSNGGIGGAGNYQQPSSDPSSQMAMMGGTPAGTITSQTGSGGGMSGLLQALMGQAQTDQTNRTNQYNTLQKSILGKNGYLGQLGKVGMAQLNRAQNNAQGGLTQNLVSRGLGNSTIQNSLSSGINRDFTEQKQNLQAAVGGQKSGAAMNLFNMNPAPSSSTYLDLLTRLGASGQGGSLPSIPANGR